MTTFLKAPALQILFPGPEAWERWKVDPSGATESQAMDEPAFDGSDTRRVLALPAAATFAIPLWVFAENDEELRGVTQLHLEKEGLSRPEEPLGFDLERILAQGNRVLIRIDVLSNQSLQLRPDSSAPDVVCLSPRLLPLPDRQIVVWKELGKFVTAITRNDRVVYHNVIAASRFDGRAAEEVLRWARQLQFQGIVEALQCLTLWTESAEPKEIEARTGLPVVVEPRPAPQFQAGASSAIVPSFVEELRRRELRKARIRKGLFAGSAVAGLALLGSIAASLLVLQQRREVLDRIADLSPAASDIQRIQQRWAEVAVAVDPDQSPLELMLLIHRLPSAGQVTIHRFERNRQRLLLNGRATSPSEALKFLGAISKSDQLSHYRWTYTQPLIAQDGTASFEIEGVLSSLAP